MCCSIGYRVYFIVMLTVIMLGAVVLSVVPPLVGLPISSGLSLAPYFKTVLVMVTESGG
jgi:hypothetical protein